LHLARLGNNQLVKQCRRCRVRGEEVAEIREVVLVCSEMVDDVDIAKCTDHRISIANITPDKLGRPRQIVWNSSVVDRRSKKIENTNVVATLEQSVDGM